MRTIRTVSELRRELDDVRRRGLSIGLVPTMGALHAGHLSLITRARELSDLVVVSLFVNPTQFNEGADLAAYPRTEVQDAELAARAGADLLFAPGVAEIYPSGFATTVSVGGVSEVLEGAHRGRGHFDGVSTVVTKLLNIVGADVACFGQKDAQQALVIRRLVADLEIRTRIEICPTVRDADGVALSSRNVRLSPAERERARALNRALVRAGELSTTGERNAVTLLEAARAELEAADVDPEYLVLADPGDLSPVDALDRPALLLVAAHVGATRLIDNRLLEPTPAPLVSDPVA